MQLQCFRLTTACSLLAYCMFLTCICLLYGAMNALWHLKQTERLQWAPAECCVCA